MQALIVGAINFFGGLIDTIFPDLSLHSEVAGSVANGINKVIEIIKVVNYIIPINQILLMFGILITIKLFKIGIFFVNWVINKITALIP